MLRFLAPEIPEIIFRKYFRGSRMLGEKDKNFMSYINKEFISLVTTALYFCLKLWSSGTYDGPGKFRGIEQKGKTALM
jgi:hypothetical protein